MSSRSLLILCCSVALSAPTMGALAPAASAADSSGSLAREKSVAATPLAPAKKKKKNKDKGKTIATVNADWTVTESRELQGGTETQEIKISVKGGKVKFSNDKDTRGTGLADVTVTYRGHFFTDDRSWHIGCDTEERTMTATYSDNTWIDVTTTDSWIKDGVSEKIGNGWSVSLDRPLRELARTTATTGYYLDWESLLQDQCNTYPISDPLVWWSPNFVTSYAVTGKLNGGGKGVVLTRPFTNRDQTATANGKIEFSESVEKRGTRSGGGSLN